ncbi:MAG: aminoacyl-tRNA hydrolase [Actinomycetota bacterium]|nr:aminoacyl-tRNA hydrolase [Actinomycetota bacterium]
MILIVGLGNPGKNYEFTRHNIGFRIADRFAGKLEKKSCYPKFMSMVIESSFSNRKIIILKPQTFMNKSGEAVALCSSYYKDKINSMLVIHDDIDISFGDIALKKGGGTAGHKGLESIAASLKSYDFDRLRFGVGRPAGRQDASDFVLKEFSRKEKVEVKVGIEKSVDIMADYITGGIQYAMNKYN